MQETKPKLILYLLLLGGPTVLIALWAWALSDGVKLPKIAMASLVTVLLSVGGGRLAAQKTRDYSRLPEEAAAAARLIALPSLVFGLCILVWEYVPSRMGRGGHVDRRYALLFFAIAVYLFVLSFRGRNNDGTEKSPRWRKFSKSSYTPNDEG